MSQGYLVGVIVRLFSLYLLISTLRSATAMFVQSPPLEVNRWTVTGLAIPVIAAVFMWAFNLTIAKRLFYGGTHERPLDLSAVVHLEQALFSVVGLWLVCSGLVECTYWLMFFSEVSSPKWVGYFAFGPEQTASMIASFVQTLLGFFLMFRANGLARLIQRLRG